MKHILQLICFLGVFLPCLPGFGQAVCPQNIGFEEGSFNKWTLWHGSVLTNGELQLLQEESAASHSILKYSYPEAKDYYGDFSVNCPNGSGYSLMLGNAATNKGAEKITYTFTVPTNSVYNLIYNYAVVFQNPSHADFEQPKFTAKVFDVTDNKYTSCGSFEFVASSGLPGFQKAKNGSEVFFKDWAPVSINLSGFGGKTLRLEFTTNDCTRGGHFGYAYIDINENCAEQITGSAYCIGDEQVRLTAPAGFKEYYWMDENFSRVLGTTNILTVKPAPPDNTRYALRIVPYEGYGCPDTLFTTIKSVGEEIILKTKPLLEGCEFPGVDISDKSIFEGSSPGLTYSYFSDEFATRPIPKDAVRKSGRYYIKASNIAGCYKINPVDVIVYGVPNIALRSLEPACFPSTVDLSSAINLTDTEAGLTFTYWKDAEAKISLSNYSAIETTGTYYIKGTNRLGCSVTLPVSIFIGAKPVLKLQAPEPCPPVNLTAASVYSGSTVGLDFTYWLDSKATIPIPDPGNITVSGRYYLKGTSFSGCSTIDSVDVFVYKNPDLILKPDQIVTYPNTVDLEDAITPVPGTVYTFWEDKEASRKVLNPNNLNSSGTYYIRGVDQNGCSAISPVTVEIRPSAIPEILAPNTFTPNNDGVNDKFVPQVTGVVQVNYFKIYNRLGEVIFSTRSLSDGWDGNFNGTQLPTGTYYWVFDGLDLYRNVRSAQSGAITLIR